MAAQYLRIVGDAGFELVPDHLFCFFLHRIMPAQLGRLSTDMQGAVRSLPDLIRFGSCLKCKRILLRKILVSLAPNFMQY